MTGEFPFAAHYETHLGTSVILLLLIVGCAVAAEDERPIVDAAKVPVEPIANAALPTFPQIAVVEVVERRMAAVQAAFDASADHVGGAASP